MFSLILCVSFEAIPAQVPQIKPVTPLKPKVVPPDVPLNPAMADLLISNISITPSTPREGKDMVQIQITVRNAGSKTLPKVCSVSMELWNLDTHPNYHHAIIPWYTNNIPQLAPGSEVKISKTITIPYAGNYKLDGVIITEGLQVGDENPQNNKYLRTFQVLPKPMPADLVLESLMPTNDRRIRMKLYNGGSSIPAIDFNVCRMQIEVNDAFTRVVPLSTVDPSGVLKNNGSGVRVYLEYTWPSEGPNGYVLEASKTYKVRVTIDPYTAVTDSDPSNNSKTVIWHMTP
jgi:hypothetical protein